MSETFKNYYKSALPTDSIEFDKRIINEVSDRYEFRYLILLSQFDMSENYLQKIRSFHNIDQRIIDKTVNMIERSIIFPYNIYPIKNNGIVLIFYAPNQICIKIEIYDKSINYLIFKNNKINMEGKIEYEDNSNLSDREMTHIMRLLYDRYDAAELLEINRFNKYTDHDKYWTLDYYYHLWRFKGFRSKTLHFEEFDVSKLYPNSFDLSNCSGFKPGVKYIMNKEGITIEVPSMDDLNEKLYPSLEIYHFNPDAKISLGGEPKKYE